MLKKVGIDLVPRAYESTTWVSRLRRREFTGSFWGWGWGPGVVGPNARMLFHSASIPPGGANFAGYRNAKVDALIDSVIVETDTTRARAMWTQIEQAVTDDAVYAPIFLDPEFYAVNQRFRNVKFRGPEWWEDVIYWWIPENQRTPLDRSGGRRGGRKCPVPSAQELRGSWVLVASSDFDRMSYFTQSSRGAENNSGFSAPLLLCCSAALLLCCSAALLLCCSA
jgi:hypothetical protein